jgi:hypothetical protein
MKVRVRVSGMHLAGHPQQNVCQVEKLPFSSTFQRSKHSSAAAEAAKNCRSRQTRAAVAAAA